MTKVTKSRGYFGDLMTDHSMPRTAWLEQPRIVGFPKAGSR